MKNTFGQSVSVTLFGESHGEEIGIVIDGLSPGIEIDEEYIAQKLSLRRPKGRISTARKETDPFRILSGVHNGMTTGTPICILIPNGDTKSKDYSALENLARPGHADYSAQCKYHGFQDKRGGGHFSGRITAPIVAAGAIALKVLENKGIYIGTHIKECHGIKDRGFENILSDIKELSNMEFPVLCKDSGDKIHEEILLAANDGDSVGGILETAVWGIPAGVGEPWFDSVESVLSHILFSVPAIKGVEFGIGFDFAKKRGSEANDSFKMENGDVVTVTNNNGGINGGITNGMPIIFSCVVKPTPSIYKQQKTVDYINKEDATLNLGGRHDPAIIHRARIVIDSVTALALCDMLAQRYGTDWLR
ncbi:MAG: chorismate synthase [Ruminococcaceae bacterium]|nr:chorismate synthase [Oscillospiraceae bacterium]